MFKYLLLIVISFVSLNAQANTSIKEILDSFGSQSWGKFRELDIAWQKEGCEGGANEAYVMCAKTYIKGFGQAQVTVTGARSIPLKLDIYGTWSHEDFDNDASYLEDFTLPKSYRAYELPNSCIKGATTIEYTQFLNINEREVLMHLSSSNGNAGGSQNYIFTDYDFNYDNQIDCVKNDRRFKTLSDDFITE